MPNGQQDYSHFLAKLTPEGGPDPATELRNIVDQCRSDPGSVAWLATRNNGRDFWCAGNSICVIFHRPDRSPRVEAVVARVLTKSSPPQGAAVREFYREWSDRLNNWWPLGGKRSNVMDVVLTEFDSLADIPGHHWESGNRAGETFIGMCAFAGWRFEETFRPLDWLRSLPGTRP